MSARSDGADDAGLSLIELIVAIVVSAIVMAGIVTVFVNSWKTQEDVLSVTEATNRGQLVGAMIEKAVRNGIDIKLTEGPDGDTLLVRTSLSSECQGFYVGSVDGGPSTVRTITSDSALPDDISTWPVWDPEIALEAAESSLTPNGRGAAYALLIRTDSAPVRIEGNVMRRTPTDEGGAPCWP